ncbi:FMRFamide-related peptides [Manduca sexta]|uniref:FMRFamide-related peptides n=1 Tax=Manduca sexta TaxID=7130 RepID=UPI00118422D5|nr:FMRFamide-related peptides [Manduca sexta]
MSCSRCMVVFAALVLVIGATASPVRRSPDLEARRRSAIDRSMIRFGRSYPPEPSAADIRDAFRTRRGNSFLRFGRSQPMTLTSDDLISLLRAYEEDYDSPVSKKSASFVRFGRDPSFIRFGRSADDEKVAFEAPAGNTYPQRKHRARDHFIRLGRDSEELNEENFDEDMESRRKRAAECSDCA